MDYAQEYHNFERSIVEANSIIPYQVWPIPTDDAFWELYLVPYTIQINKAKSLFFDKINALQKMINPTQDVDISPHASLEPSF